MSASVRTRVFIAAALWSAGALLGALLGWQYYFPHPPSLSDAFVITDLRHAGAVIGALAGALAARATRRFFLGRKARSPLFIAVGCVVGLEFLLLQSYPLVGLVTTAILGLPWIPLTFTLARPRREEPAERSSGKHLEPINRP
jgi:hypothetical protein